MVNAGPAVFISTSGPNPIMVQPLPFQPGTSFGAMPTGLSSSYSAGSGSRPRNIDIRIRTGNKWWSIYRNSLWFGENNGNLPLLLLFAFMVNFAVCFGFWSLFCYSLGTKSEISYILEGLSVCATYLRGQHERNSAIGLLMRIILRRG